jgi:curli production assembly/transport component CsgG
MKKILIALAVASLMSGCAVTQKMGVEYKPEVAARKMQKEFDTVPLPNGPKVTVAVYSFKDQTGQRKSVSSYASFSTAVTQGAEPFLISALQDVGHGQWFDVVERVNVDNLIKERTIIKQMRDMYEGANAKPLAPLQFAGIIIEGGIIGYDSSSESGGAAYRWLGIGPQTQYSKDIVTISLRAVSVNTGKVLSTVTVTKTVYSTADSFAMLKFFRDGTQAFEAETGLTINEPGTLAVKATVEAAVVALIKDGQERGVWDFRPATPPVVVTPPPAVVKEPEAPLVIVPEKKSEVKVPDDVAAKEGVAPPTVEVPKLLVEDTKVLNKLSFLYAKPNEDAQKRWQLPAGTKLIVAPKENGWYFVDDGNNHRGYVQSSNLN